MKKLAQAQVGSEVALDCRPRASPRAQSSWKRGEVAVQDNGRYLPRPPQRDLSPENSPRAILVIQPAPGFAGEKHRAVPGWGVSEVYRSRVQVRGGQATWPLESRRWGELKWRQRPVGWGCQEPACWEEKRVLPQPSALPSCLGSSGRA